jgi:hypothetical protein
MARPPPPPPSRPAPPRRASGSSLIELMIAMAVLAVGLLAMWHLHVLGITSTAAGRRHTIATAVAHELLSGLERLPFSDRRLDPTPAACTGPASEPPAGCVFGSLVDGDAVRGGAHDWDDSDAGRIPGVRKDGEMPEKAELFAGEMPQWERHWTVWAMSGASAPAGTVGAKLIAVSVIWRDPPFARPREVLLYAQVANPSAVVSGLRSSE